MDIKLAFFRNLESSELNLSKHDFGGFCVLFAPNSIFWTSFFFLRADGIDVKEVDDDGEDGAVAAGTVAGSDTANKDGAVVADGIAFIANEGAPVLVAVTSRQDKEIEIEIRIKSEIKKYKVKVEA